MPRLRSVGLVLLLVFTACITKHPSAVRPYIGQYRGSSGDFVLIESEGTLLWLPPGTDGSRAHYVGLFWPDTPWKLGIASASPYLGTKLSISDDGRVLTIDWSMPEGHSKTFERIQ